MDGKKGRKELAAGQKRKKRGAVVVADFEKVKTFKFRDKWKRAR